MEKEVIVQDPFGKPVHLMATFFSAENESAEVYDDAATVIQKPAMVVEVKENNATEFYYFRSVGWNNTLLITVRLNNEWWEAYDFVKNPSNEMLSKVLKKGTQIL